MKYTREQYEAFYYLHKLLPYLKTFDDRERRFNFINRAKEKGLLVPILKEENENGTRRNLYPQIIDALAKYGSVYTKLVPSTQQNNVSYLVRTLHLNPKEEMIVRF